MAYKKFIKKGGKTFGPYYYESYRDENGKIKKRYLGTVDPSEKEKRVTPTLKSLFFPTVILLSLFFVLVAFSQVGDVQMSGLFSEVKEFVGESYGGMTGLVVDEIVSEDVVEEVVQDVVDEPEIVSQISDDSGESEEVVESLEEVVEVVVEVVDDPEVVEVVESLDEEVDQSVVESVTEEEIENVTEEVVENVTEVPVSNETVNDSVVENVTEVIVNESLLNDTLVNESVLNETLVNESVLNETNVTVVENVTELNLTMIDVSEISTLQYKAVIGRPVKWMKKINVTNRTNVSIEIPKGASNISVLTNDEIGEAEDAAGDYEDVVSGSDREDLSGGSIISGNVVADLKEGEGILTRVWNYLTSFSISGNVVLEEELGEKIVEGENSTVVELDDVVDLTGVVEVAVEYSTEAPVANESELVNGKRVVVSADSDLGYTEILAYALVEEDVAMDDSHLKLYWFEEGENLASDCTDLMDLIEETNCKLVNGSDGVRKSVDFVSYDFDGDGFVDYVEWVVPHLSAQVYELIYIVKAEHLDSNRSFVADVYDLVKARDNVSVFVGDGEYLRVTFEVELDSSKDITIFARQDCADFILINDMEVPCDVYWKKVRIDELRREDG